MSTNKRKQCLTRNGHCKTLSSIPDKSKLQTPSVTLSLHQFLNINLNNNQSKYTPLLTERPLSINRLQENDLGVNNLLSKVKRNILCFGSDSLKEMKGNYSSKALLTSPHVAEGLKCKYSHIYLETINPKTNHGNQKFLMSNIYAAHSLSKLEVFNKKKEELIELINHNQKDDDKAKGNNNRKNCNDLLSSSSKKRKVSPSRRQINILKEIAYQISLTQGNNSIFKKQQETNEKGKTKKLFDKKKNKVNEYSNDYNPTICSPNNNDDVERKLSGFQNKEKINPCSKIQETQIRLEKMLTTNRAPIVFPKNDTIKLKATHEKSQQEQAAFDDFITVLSSSKEKYSKNKPQQSDCLLNILYSNK